MSEDRGSSNGDRSNHSGDRGRSNHSDRGRSNHSDRERRGDMSDDEPSVLMELRDENLLRCAQFCTETRTVFFIVDYFCDESTGLANCNVMFRGDEAAMEKIIAVRLALFDPKALAFATLALASRDPENEDPRVLLFKSWTEAVPLPLGGVEVKGSSVSRLAIVVFHAPNWDSNTLKLGADIIPNPAMYLEGSKCRRPLKDAGGGCVIRVQHGRIFEIINPQNALELEGGLIDGYQAQATIQISPEEVEEMQAALAEQLRIGDAKPQDTVAKPNLPLWIRCANQAEYGASMVPRSKTQVVPAEDEGMSTETSTAKA
jgi:hypothetical protein